MVAISLARRLSLSSASRFICNFICQYFHGTQKIKQSLTKADLIRNLQEEKTAVLPGLFAGPKSLSE